MAKQTKKTENPSPEEKTVKETKTVKAKATTKAAAPAVKITPAKTAKPKAKATVAENAPEPKPKAAVKAKAAAQTTHVMLNAVEPYSRFTDFDISLFKSGKHYKLYEKFGSHVVEFKEVVGTYFAVWAPNAQHVSVIGNFNGWNRASHGLLCRWDSSGIWEGFIPNVGVGETYKYYIKSSTGEDLEKSDPFALRWELPPRTASIVADTYYEWKDGDWMANRHEHNGINRPYSVYEVHLGSWARSLESPDEFLTYTQLAHKLLPYVKDMGFTHVEFSPVLESP